MDWRELRQCLESRIHAVLRERSHCRMVPKSLRQNGAYYFFFANMPTNTRLFYIEVEGIVNEASGEGLHIGQYDWGCLGVSYYDSSLPSNYAGTGLAIATAFLGFTNS